MERVIHVDISEENGDVYISEDDSSGASYPIDFSNNKKNVIRDLRKAFNTYIVNYLNIEYKIEKSIEEKNEQEENDKENDYEME